jgi:putative MATE family efflux protein
MPRTGCVRKKLGKPVGAVSRIGRRGPYGRGVPDTRPPAPGRDREIARLAIPALGALVAEPLFLLADSAVVATLGTAPLAGLGAAAVVLSTAVGMCVFLAYGTTAVSARLVGAGDRAGALARGVDGMWLAAGLGVALAVAGWLSAGWLVRALGASEAVAPYAETYLRISMAGLPAVLLALAATGLLRGLQDTRTPLAVTVVAVTANLALDLLFVLGLEWGIAGSAWASVLAQWGAAAAYLLIVARQARRLRAALGPRPAGIASSLSLNAALLARTAALRGVFLLAAAVAARLGDAELAAYQVTMQTWYLLALALDALAIAGQALTGRDLGSGDAERARATARRVTWWGFGVGCALAGLVLLLRPWYGSWFGDDPAVAALIGSALVVVAVHQPLAGPVFALDGVLIGAGDARWLAYAQAASLAVFAPAAWAVLAYDGGLDALWWALLWFMAVRGALLGWRAHSGRWAVTGAVR